MRKINGVIFLSDVKLQDNFATCDLQRSLVHTTAGIKDLHMCIYKMTLLLIDKRKKEEKERRKGGRKKKNKRKIASIPIYFTSIGNLVL